MRYSLFDNQQEADSFAAEVQAACDANHVEGTPRIIKSAVFIQWINKWAVSREFDPPEVRGEDVETVEQPSEGKP